MNLGRGQEVSDPTFCAPCTSSQKYAVYKAPLLHCSDNSQTFLEFRGRNFIWIPDFAHFCPLFLCHPRSLAFSVRLPTLPCDQGGGAKKKIIFLRLKGTIQKKI